MKYKLTTILLSFICVFCFLLFTAGFTFANSEYILPYPSDMPGSKFYKIHQIYEQLVKYWYFGDLGQYKYNLRYSDKYLVEAKTLFEYKQYYLAVQALDKSNKYFTTSRYYLQKAKKGKNVTQKEVEYKNAALKHTEILELIKKITPEQFTWQPEKTKATDLDLKKIIEESIKIRMSNN